MAKRKKIDTFRSGTSTKTITTRAGKTFRAYRKQTRFSKTKYFRPNQPGMGEYFDSTLKPQFYRFYRSHRAKGRKQFTFRVKTQLNLKGQRISNYISSLRSEYRSDEDFETNMERFRRDFVMFMDEYLFGKAMSSLSVAGTGAEVIYTPKKRKSRKGKKKNARKPKKIAGKKKKAKKISSRRHRKR